MNRIKTVEEFKSLLKICRLSAKGLLVTTKEGFEYIASGHTEITQWKHTAFITYPYWPFGKDPPPQVVPV